MSRLLPNHCTAGVIRLCAGILLALFANLLWAAGAMPGAGTAISTRAEAIYGTPWASGLVKHSNIIIVQVRAVEALTLTASQAAFDVRPGATVHMPLVLRNTGNTPSTYRFALPAQTRRASALSGLALYHDTNGNGIADSNDRRLSIDGMASPGGGTLVLAAGQQAALVLVATLPAGTTGSIPLTLLAMTQDPQVAGRANLTIRAATGAVVHVQKWASESIVEPGGKVSFWVKANNAGTQAAIGTDRADGQLIQINGQPQRVFLLRDRLPQGATYVPGSLKTLANGDALQLFRDAADASYHYRTAPPSDPARIVEVAVAVPAATGLLAGTELSVTFQLSVAKNFAGDKLLNTADAFFVDSADSTHAPAKVSSNQAFVSVGAPQETDFISKISYAGDYFAGGRGQFTLTAANQGKRASRAPITLAVALPDGLRAVSAQGEGWTCAGVAGGSARAAMSTANIMQCTSSQRLAQHAVSTPVKLDVAIADGVVPAGQASVSLTARLNVSGSDEPDYLGYNNTATSVITVAAGASISGRAWVDQDMDGHFDGGATPLKGWRAQLLQGPARVSAGATPAQIDWVNAPVVKEALADEQGRYHISGIAPGRVYALRFVSASGRWLGVPLDGSPNGPQAGVERDFQHGLLVYRQLASNQQYHEQNLAIVPSGIVYNAVTREPVAGATVQISAAQAGFDPARHLIGGANNATLKTDENGFYYFRLAANAPAGEYRLTVQQAVGYHDGVSLLLPPQKAPMRLPAGQGLVPVVPQLSAPAPGETPSYYVAFIRSAALARGIGDGPARMVNNHVPLDPVDTSANALVLTKEADRPAVEIIDFVNYKMTLSHTLPSTLTGFDIADTLPPGFNYIPGTARLLVGGAAQAIADPAVQGGQLNFSFPTTALPSGAQAVVTYRARVGATVQEGTRAISRARASSAPYTSNEAAAVVKIVGGVFSSDAFVAGKVFLDCDGDGTQGPGEPGVPGVRVYLEDGTYAQTDIDGKYSFYGIKPLTHVLKLDPTTLPQGASALPLDQRNAGRGDSRFLDLRNGELGRGDFALSCNDGVRKIVQARHDRLAAADAPDELSLAIAQRMEAVPAEQANSDIKSRPASGSVDARGIATTAAATVPDDTPPAPGGSPAPGGPASGNAPGTPGNPLPALPINGKRASTLRPAAAAPDTDTPLEKLLPQQDASIDFIGLKDGDIVSENMPRIRVKGSADAHFSLEVNGEPVNEKQVGKRSVLKEKNLAAWEYFGVDLNAGENVLVLRAATPQGTIHEKRIRIVLPGPLAVLKLAVAGTPVADGVTPVRIDIRTEDAQGLLTGRRIPLTLTASAGEWQVKDLDERTSGVQTVMEGGTASFMLMPPAQPGPVVLSAQSGSLRIEQTVNFVPALRPMMAVGILEGVISLRNGLIQSASRDNGFERELTHLSRTWGDGRDSANARAAFFLKGKVKGEYLLTAAYDSEKDVKDRLFRDIEPDKFYPIYGDSSLRGFDAQSTSRLYLRVDKGATYLLYGDFSTASHTELRQLTQYNRSVTGLSHHYQNDRVSANVFASRDNLEQRVFEIPTNGTSGPFTVFAADYVDNSERVEIVTRDRSQSGLIVKTQTLTRFVDYEIETLSGQLRLRRPWPSVDPDTGNPNFLRITYESDGSGPKFWVVGGDVQVKATDWLSLGAVAVEDRNPANARHLRGATALAQLGPHTTLAGEYASTSSDKKGHGAGARAELRHEAGHLKARLSTVVTDTAFDNVSAPVQAGHTETRGRIDYQLDDKHILKGEVVRTIDRPTEVSLNQPLTPVSGGATGDFGVAGNLEYTGALFGIERALAPGLKAEIGTRIVRGTAQTGSGTADIDVTTLRGQITSVVPGLPKASVFTSYEQDIHDRSKRALAVGGTYALGAGSRLYGRHEIISSLGSLYDLNGSQRTYRTLFGIDSEYVKDGRVFSEYRQGGAIDGRDAQAAFGVRNGWELRPGLRLSTTFERTRTVSGDRGGQGGAQDSSQATAVTGAVEYLASQRWKGSTSFELRRSSTEEAILNTWGVAMKLTPDWSLLAKSAVYRVTGRGTQDAAADSLRMRQRVGVAWRQTERNAVNALGYYEHRLETGRLATETTDRRQAHIMSSHVNVKPARRITFSGRYAYKHLTEAGGALTTSLHAHLLSSRVTWDVARRWDIGVAASTLFDSANQRRHAVGLEVGYRFKDDLWVSVGHNIVGFYDRDFNDQVQTTRGVYFRVRYKFDENGWS